MLQGSELYFVGYIIEGKVLYLQKTRRLVSLHGCDENIILRKTMSRVLEYLFKHATVEVVTDAQLMNHVWDKHGLSSSTQRVWQVMSNFKSRLSAMGISDSIILRVDKKGYLLKRDSIRMLLSCRVDAESESLFSGRLSGYDAAEKESQPPHINDSH